MDWFALPDTGTDSPPAFVDMASCQGWLAEQPLANAPLMQETFAEQISRLNRWKMSARERYKVLETLRKPLFVIDKESARRHEHRPLPLAPVEQRALDCTCRYWRGMATGYLHCLRAHLDGDASLAPHAAKVAHRALSSLRLEQLARYRAGAAVPGEWWKLLNRSYAAVDHLALAGVPIGDRLFAETRESTPAGQYAMAILLHLARPHELSRSQLSAAQRWFARWRERASIRLAPELRAHAIDLDSATPLRFSDEPVQRQRWLAVAPVLSKLKSRMTSLREGKSPEELKLGTGLSSEACIALMQFLHGALQSPLPLPSGDGGMREIHVASTLDAAYRLLGGPTLENREETSVHSTREIHEQIAIFGHAMSAEGAREAGTPLENWTLISDNNGDLTMLRAAGASGERIGNRSLFAITDLVVAGTPALAIVRSLCTLEDGALLANVRVQPGTPLALSASGREKMTNRIDHYPTILLPAAGNGGRGASLFVPAGVIGKLTRFDVDDLPGEMKVGEACERGTNFERLRCE